MHMADALISPAVGGVMWALSAGSMAYSVTKIKKDMFGEKKVPVMGVAGAFVFAAQMINFTIPATGSSGHIGGGILLASLLGPYASLLSIAAVLIIQALFFGDGGLLALGCNIFNMGVIPCLVVYPLLVRTLLKKVMSVPRISAASVLSVIAALQIGAFGVVLQTLASGITELPFATFAALMQPIHLAIGAVEGIITASVLCFVYKMRPETLDGAEKHSLSPSDTPVRRVVIVLAAATVVIGGLLSLFASSYPDGLEWSIENIVGTAELHRAGSVYERSQALQDTTAFMPDYNYASADGNGTTTGTSAAGIVGAALTALLAGGSGFIIYLIKKNNKSTHKMTTM